MLQATNDPLDVMRRVQAEAAREMREAQGAAGTQQYQAVRKLQATVDQVLELVIRMPQYEGRQVEVADWSPPSSWTTIAEAVIPRPDDKTRVVVSATGFVTAIAPTEALGFRARIVVNGAASPFFDGSTEGSSFITRSASYPSFVREISPLSAANVTIQLQLSVASNYNADRRATLSVLAGFSTI